MRQKLMGFFKYDNFPYCVAMEVDSVTEKGEFRVKGVGLYKASNLLLLLPMKEGRATQELINELRSDYQDAQKELRRKHKDKVEAVLGREV